jgi:DNA polymerase III alpha subunit
VNKEDASVQDVLLCVQTNTFVDERNRMRMEADEFSSKARRKCAAACRSTPKPSTSRAK